MSVNKVIVVGNLGKDPELRYTASGTAVVSFSLATTERYKDRDGNNQEKTEWHNIVAWRKLAEICGKYLTKGKQIYAEGKLQTRKWEDRDGNTRYTTEIVIDQMEMLGGGNGQGGNNQSGQNRQNNNQSNQSRQAPPQQNSGGGGGFGDPGFNPDDDIPF